MSSLVIAPIAPAAGNVQGERFKRDRKVKRDHEGFTVKETEEFIPYVWSAERHREAVRTLIEAGERRVCRCRVCKDVRKG